MNENVNADSHAEPEPPSPAPRSPSQRAMHLLPTLCTVMNLFLGYFAIIQSIDGHYRLAAFLIMMAGLLDKVDGYAARATGTSSDFGRELDSLADLISFGLAPALLAWQWGLRSCGNAGWVAAFAFVMCGALRLARFNVMTARTDKRFFIGLPIPMAASLPVTLIFAHAHVNKGNPQLADIRWSWAYVLLLLICAALMVSQFRYHALKDVQFGRQWRLVVVSVAAAVIVLIFAWPELILPLMAAIYTFHGPVLRYLRPSLVGGRTQATLA